MKEEERILLVVENDEILGVGDKCVFNDVKLITKEADAGCIGCWFRNQPNQPNCPCNVDCSNIIYVEDNE